MTAGLNLPLHRTKVTRGIWENLKVWFLIPSVGFLYGERSEI